jgi:hypothetical protein
VKVGCEKKAILSSIQIFLEHSTVSSLLERALYTYERALQVGGANVLSGCARLDFDAAEARGVWLCIGRYIMYVSFSPLQVTIRR